MNDEGVDFLVILHLVAIFVAMYYLALNMKDPNDKDDE